MILIIKKTDVYEQYANRVTPKMKVMNVCTSIEIAREWFRLKTIELHELNNACFFSRDLEIDIVYDATYLLGHTIYYTISTPLYGFTFDGHTVYNLQERIQKIRDVDLPFGYTDHGWFAEKSTPKQTGVWRIMKLGIKLFGGFEDDDRIIMCHPKTEFFDYNPSLILVPYEILDDYNPERFNLSG